MHLVKSKRKEIVRFCSSLPCSFAFINVDFIIAQFQVKIISTVRPSEIYNLAAQSHVKVSFELAEYTAEVRYFIFSSAYINLS